LPARCAQRLYLAKKGKLAMPSPAGQDPAQLTPLEEILKGVPLCLATSQDPEVDQEEALRIIDLAEIAGIPIVIDGGWSVDAHLGWQTRRHSDLDIAINQQYLPRFLGILSRLGYGHVPRGDQWEHNFVLQDGSGHQVDIHSYIRNDQGQIIGGVEYPGDSLTGQGKIGHAKVRCIKADWLVDFHLGYPFDENDFNDVKYLCNLHRLPLPPEFQAYEEALYTGKAQDPWTVPTQFSVRLPQTTAEYLALINLLDKTDVERLTSETKAKFLEIQEAQSGAQNVTLAHLAEAGLRSGVLLLEDGQGIGACELLLLENHAVEGQSSGPGNSQMQIRQLSLAKRADHASVFMSLLRAAINETWRAGGTHLSVLPLDDITQPRPALPRRYDAADIGFASFYARAGFKRLEPVPGSRFVIHQK
jgi:lincosamide nucleotidyltransferase A/C/D/E